MPKEKKEYPVSVCMCGKTFKQKRIWQKFCSGNCRWKNWDKVNPRIKKSILPLSDTLPKQVGFKNL